MPRLRTTLSALLLTTALSGPALAAPPDAAGAAALEAQLRDWAKSFLPAAIALPDRIVQVAPEGDHYRATLPLGGRDNPQITATVRPLDGGRWSIEGLRFPSPATVTMTLPSAEAKPGDGKPATERVTYNIKLAEQDGTGVFDPTWQTASTFANTIRGLTVQANIAGVSQNTQIARQTSRQTLTPTGQGRVDVAGDGMAEGYVGSSALPDGTPFRLEMSRIQVNSLMSGVSRDKAMEASRGLVALVVGLAAARGDGKPPSPADFDPATLRSLISAFRDFAVEMRVDESVEGVRFRMNEQQGGDLGALRIGFGAKSPDGMLDARLDLGIEEPKVVNPPLGPFEVFVPKRLTLRPTLSGVATADLLDMAEAALNKSPDMNQRLAGLFSRGGVRIGLENLMVDVAGATLTGQGKAVMASPMEVVGDGQIVVTNLDGLIDRVKAVPALAQGLPLLVVAKGIGRSVGATTVYDLKFDGASFTVNGTDLMALAGGGASPPPPRSTPPARPAPQPQTGPQKRQP